MIRFVIPTLIWLGLACASVAPIQAPDRAGVSGQLRLVPRDGLPGAPLAGAARGYGDRRYAHARPVDYTRPGFAVVYLEGPATAPTRPLTLRMRAGAGGVRLQPANGVLGMGAPLRVVNETDLPRVLSVPELDLLVTLAPAESLALPSARSGELTLFMPGAGPARARVFRVPGPFAAVDGAGRYEILDLPPGAYALRAWHPRFPPAHHRVELPAGVVTRMDVELGVGLDAADAP